MKKYFLLTAAAVLMQTLLTSQCCAMKPGKKSKLTLADFRKDLLNYELTTRANSISDAIKNRTSENSREYVSAHLLISFKLGGEPAKWISMIEEGSEKKFIKEAKEKLEEKIIEKFKSSEYINLDFTKGILELLSSEEKREKNKKKWEQDESSLVIAKNTWFEILEKYPPKVAERLLEKQQEKMGAKKETVQEEN